MGRLTAVGHPMTDPVFQHLLDETRRAHARHSALRTFCAFPDDLSACEVTPYHLPAAELMERDTGLFANDLASLRDAFIAAGPVARWRETYRDTNIGDDFMSRFGCYCLIGGGGPWISSQIAGYVVYMPAGLDYTWHHHPAEELYLVLAGQAEFLRKGEPAELLGPGDSSRHASNQPHAMRTSDHPVMAYVVWRNHLGIPPVLTNPADLCEV